MNSEDNSPRSPRVKLSLFHNLNCLANEISCDVLNISDSGMALAPNNGTQMFEESQTLHVLLNAHGKKFEALFRIVRKTNALLGLTIIDENNDYQKLVRDYFKHEFAGVNLAKESNTPKKADGQPHRYKGGNLCQFSYIENQGKLIRFKIQIFGHIIAQDKSGNLSFDHVLPDDSGKPPYEMVAMALKFISQIKDMPDGFFTQIETKINDGISVLA